MISERIDLLPDVLKRHMSSLKKISVDRNTSQYMCESTMKAVNFDKIPREYCKYKGVIPIPCSNDALYVSNDDKWYFIEFKNGSIDKANIYRKLYDSLIMLFELGVISNFAYAREKFFYILVYNDSKGFQVEKSPARDKAYSYFMELARQEKKLFEVEKLEKYLFQETHTYSKEEFQEYFILPMEKEEAEAEKNANKM